MIQPTTYEPEINIDVFDDEEYGYYDDDISQFEDELSEKQDINFFQARFSALGKTASFSQKLSKSVLAPPTYRDELDIDGAVQLEKYFGNGARQEFSRRFQYVAQHKNIEGSCIRTRLDQEKTTTLAFPFCPVRVDDIGDIDANDSSAIVYTDDDYTTASTFDASAVVHDVNEGRLNSPRTKYIASCVKKKVNPRMSLILRKRVTDALSLQHMGMGDELGILFAESLRDLPMVRSINLTDNNLTDISLGPIINAVVDLPGMTSLDLSSNEVNSETSRALALYLNAHTCPLKRLTLRNADVDDNECALFVEALLGNTTLIELNLSQNVIGKSENLNTVQPDLITGGEALGDLLAANSCHLQQLDVSWNMIRLDGAIALAASIAFNTFLTHLDLSYNGLGKVAGEVLGSALMKNQSLRTLHLMNNGLNHTACFAICVAIEENMTLRSVKLDGNPIGEGGGRVLMQIPLMIGSRVKVTAGGCNFLMRDIDSKFDMTAPDGFYELDMQRPYERAIALKLLKLVASRPSYVFTRFAYLPAGLTPVLPATSVASKKTTSLTKATEYRIPLNARNVKLVKVSTQVNLDSFDDQQKDTLANLRRIEKCAGDLDQARKLFEQYDADGSGALDRDELYKLLIDVGLRLDMNSFEHAVELVDVDGSGELDVDEFFDFLKAQKDEASSRIEDMLQHNVMMLAQNRTAPYVPPKRGTLFIAISDTYDSKGHKVLSSVDHANMMEVISKGVDNVSAVIHYSVQSVKLRLKEALRICECLYPIEGDNVTILVKILPHMVNPVEARSLIMNVLSFNAKALRRLELLMGNSYFPIIGIFNGYYYLDLSIDTDRTCLSKLLIQSQRYVEATVKKCPFKMGTTGDVSQVGDWSPFRNEFMNGTPTRFAVDLFNPMPSSGKLSFDFSGEDAAPLDCAVMKDSRCVNIVINACLAEAVFHDSLIGELDAMRSSSKRSLSGNGDFTSTIDQRQAEEIQLSCTKFWSRLSRRIEEHNQATLREDEWSKKEIKRANSSVPSAAIHDPIDEVESGGSDEESLFHSVFDEIDVELDPEQVLTEDLAEATGMTRLAVASSKGEDTATSVENVRRGGLAPVQNAEGDANTPVDSLQEKKQSSMSLSQRFMRETSQEILQSKTAEVPYNIKCRKIIRVFVDMLTRVYIRARHVALITKWFHIGRSYRTRHFGTYRVELIIFLFGRIVDLHNFDLVISVLTPFEISCLYCRIGILNLFNPMKPEGCVCLDLSRREERVIAKILALLSVIEPGQNWVDAAFRWDYAGEPMPGWELTQSWMTEEGLPRKGYLFVNYDSGNGKRTRGCIPDVTARKAFLCMVKIDEKYFLVDENNILENGDRVHITLVGKSYCKSHSNIFHDYLAPVDSTSARLVQGDTFLEIFHDYHTPLIKEGVVGRVRADKQVISGNLKGVKPTVVAENVKTGSVVKRGKSKSKSSAGNKKVKEKVVNRKTSKK